MIGLLMMLAMAGEGAAEARSPGQDIMAFCDSSVHGTAKPTAAVSACIAAQRQALKHYLGIWVMFDAPKAAAERCMRAAKTGAHVDWVKAEACLRAWSGGRRATLPGQ